MYEQKTVWLVFFTWVKTESRTVTTLYYSYSFSCSATFSTSVTGEGGVQRVVSLEESAAAYAESDLLPNPIEYTADASNGKSCAYDGVFSTSCTIPYLVEFRDILKESKEKTRSLPTKVSVCANPGGLKGTNDSGVPDLGLTRVTLGIQALSACKESEIVWTLNKQQSIMDPDPIADELYACLIAILDDQGDKAQDSCF